MAMTDENLTPEVGAWSKDKYDLVSSYCNLFSKAMKNKWDCRVYIDLFCGAGKVRIKDTNEIVYSSPMLALSVENKFDKYIFCDEDEEKIVALKKRVNNEHSESNTSYVVGDANSCIRKIISEIPQYNPQHKVLSFCFIDPYNIGSLKFETIEQLSQKFMDFLILIPTHMEFRRFVISKFTDRNDSRIEDFTGCSNWREQFYDNEVNKDADIFLTNVFAEGMKKLGYNYSGVTDTQLIRYHKTGLPLYRLAFFSRNNLGKQFWNNIKKSCNRQMRICD